MNKKITNIAKFESAYAEAMEANPSGAGLALDKCTSALRKAVAKASEGQSSDDWALERVTQTRGPTLLFTGRLLASFTTNKTSSKERWQEGELYETRKGAYIAVLMGNSDVEGEIDFVQAAVIEPGSDEAQRRLDVMEGFRWAMGARSMVRDQLDWDISVEID